MKRPQFLRAKLRYDFVVAGAGMAGIAAAMTAARHGARVALVQDRPVLGGNASKEIRVWLNGASGGANALYFRETGLMEELLLENQCRNPDGNPELWDAVLLEKVLGQKGLDLFLNTVICGVRMAGKRIAAVIALTLAAERLTTFEAPFFADCTGDGTVGFLAGAPYMTGREARREFGESLAPARRRADTLGGSILFWARDAGRPVEFHAPEFAYKFTEKDFRAGRNPVPEFDQRRHGFWWTEWGGTLDTIHDDEAIKLEILKIAYGLFDFLKNDPGQKEKNRNLTLEWIGALPGKRESRRFVGDHILTERDVRERTEFADAVAYGGWNLDDHAPRGFHDDKFPPATHTHIPGLYNIPLRCLYSKTVPDLFFAGRNISATHVAFTSTRVMLTCAQVGEAVGGAAALCLRRGLTPRELACTPAVKELQQRLLCDDHYIVGVRGDLHPGAAFACSRALGLGSGGWGLGAGGTANKDVQGSDVGWGPTARASSQLDAARLEEPSGASLLDKDRLVLFPAGAGALPWAEVLLSAAAPTTLEWELHRPDGRGGTIPAARVAAGRVGVPAGQAQWIRVPLAARLEEDDWRMLELKRSPALSWHHGSARLVGLMAFEERRPGGRAHSNQYSRFGKINSLCYCVRLPRDERLYAPDNVLNGFARPFRRPNLWVSRPTDFSRPEWLEVSWAKAARVREVVLLFDSDLNRHIVNIGARAPHLAEPDLVKDYDVELRTDRGWRKLAGARGNYLRRRVHALARPNRARALRLTIHATNGTPRAQVYEVRIVD